MTALVHIKVVVTSGKSGKPLLYYEPLRREVSRLLFTGAGSCEQRQCTPIQNRLIFSLHKQYKKEKVILKNICEGNRAASQPRLHVKIVVDN